jgi:serine/threonine protein kinase
VEGVFAVRVCPSCRTEYAQGEVFCPLDASRLLNHSQAPPVQKDPSDPIVGTVLAGRYEVVRRIGEGGMGLVYSGKHRAIGKQVAIKVLRDDLSRRPDVLERFRQEANSASRIGHQNIVDVFDFGETAGGASYFVMEYLEGEDLADVLAKEYTVDPQRACDIVIQCSRALGAAHSMGIVHRDIKPENIFLTKKEDVEGDFVKIVDFGIAKMSDVETEGVPGRKLTKTGMIFGTPEYMSPEQAAGRHLDHRVDVYALGTILYECLAGRTPFVGDSFMGILTQHMFHDPPPISDLNPGAKVTPELELVVRKALAKDPDYRYQSMRELRHAIAAALEGRVSETTLTQFPTIEPKALTGLSPLQWHGRSARGPWRWLAAGLGLMGIAALAWLVFLRFAGTDAESAQTAVFRVPIPVPLGQPGRPTEPEPSKPARVRLALRTRPSGAKVVSADGELLCVRAPCDVEVVPGEPLALRATLGHRKGKAEVTPNADDTVLIKLSEPATRKQTARPNTQPKARNQTRSSDLKVPEWAR